MGRRSLVKDIGIDEMLKMRDSGMTNADIANALGVTYSAIYRLIGKQPPGHGGYVSSQMQLSPAAVAKPEPVAAEASLVVEDRTVNLSGLFADYCVHSKAKTVDIFFNDSDTAVTVPIDDLSTFVSELRAISDHSKQINVGNEMW